MTDLSLLVRQIKFNIFVQNLHESYLILGYKIK